jgi:hypothetical protein
MFFLGHQKDILAISELPEFIESDIFIAEKNRILHAIHAKTNLDTNEEFKLLGKLFLSGLAVSNTWVILERKITNLDKFVKRLPDYVGIIYFTGEIRNSLPTIENINIGRFPKPISNPKFEPLTQRHFHRLKDAGELDKIKYFMITGIETKQNPNWTIGKNNRVWGLEKEREFNKIKSAPAGSFVFFMISDYTKPKSSGEVIGLYSLVTPFKDMKEILKDKFFRVWKDKDYSYRCDMMPVIIDQFEKGVTKKIVNKILKYKAKHVMYPSITPINQNQFERILMELIKRNKTTLLKEILNLRKEKK